MSSRDYFKGKRIAIVGLGPQGEMVEDIKFLIKAGAFVGVYDLKSEARLKSHLVFLRSIGLANYVCGSIPGDDLVDMDIIVLSHEYPRDSSFLAAAKEKNIPIEYPETLLFKQAPPVTLVGIMGAYGKSTIMSMLAPMLQAACAAVDGQGFFTVDPESGHGIISHLKKIKTGDIVLCRIAPDMMKELHGIRTSPHVAVCTSVPLKSSYSASPFEILAYQTYNNFLIASNEIIDLTHSLKVQPKAKMLRTTAAMLPEHWQFPGSKGKHDRDNAALALQAARLFKVSDDVAENILSRWKSPKGRLELVKKARNVEFYNDSSSVTALSTELAVRTLSQDRNLVLIFGGADSGADFRTLYSVLPKYVHTIILLPGSGTMRERPAIDRLAEVAVVSAPSIEEAARLAFDHAHKGDRIVFSPGFEALGVDSSRKERGEKFVRAVRGI